MPPVLVTKTSENEIGKDKLVIQIAEGPVQHSRFKKHPMNCYKQFWGETRRDSKWSWF